MTCEEERRAASNINKITKSGRFLNLPGHSFSWDERITAVHITGRRFTILVFKRCRLRNNFEILTNVCIFSRHEGSSISRQLKKAGMFIFTLFYLFFIYSLIFYLF